MIERKHILQSDSVGFPRDRKTAAAAMAFLMSVERGTAVMDAQGFVDLKVNTNGGWCAYRALAGDLYPAKIIRSNPDATIDIDVYPPGARDPVPLTNIKVQR